MDFRCSCRLVGGKLPTMPCFQLLNKDKGVAQFSKCKSKVLQMMQQCLPLYKNILPQCISLCFFSFLKNHSESIESFQSEVLPLYGLCEAMFQTVQETVNFCCIYIIFYKRDFALYSLGAKSLNIKKCKIVYCQWIGLNWF